MNEEDLARAKFFKDFEERFSEKIVSIEMVNLIGNADVFEKLNLKHQLGMSGLWGLLVFCENKKIYFYVNPNESMMSAMMRVASHGDFPKEQVVCLSDVKGFKIWKEKSHWYDLFFGNSRFELLAELGEEKKIRFLFETQNPASEVITVKN